VIGMRSDPKHESHAGMMVERLAERLVCDGTALPGYDVHGGYIRSFDVADAVYARRFRKSPGRGSCERCEVFCHRYLPQFLVIGQWHHLRNVFEVWSCHLKLGHGASLALSHQTGGAMSWVHIAAGGDCVSGESVIIEKNGEREDSIEHDIAGDRPGRLYAVGA